ncbi:HlyD family type I secretion periplasmic adaptor subunit [Bosea sp. Leaf344]|uniref:HlyD family type I secretion periplasmic adaptor subunit n=1 Tax=Bosea sp. Leaf344 TaxID=1736346 RepID=UPI0009E9391C|nr:HlyD family type I secretion periplasmic adaptor subunit [Bosea sp. Leaf344]
MPLALPSPATTPPGRPLADPWRSIRRMALAGIATLMILFGTIGIWAATAPLSSAVIAWGRVVLEHNLRRIQHPAGGVVAAIHVRDGDHVEAGAVLVRLDATNARAALSLIEIELGRLIIRKARLEAERAGQDGFAPPMPAIADAVPAIAEALATEQGVFRARREAMAGQVAQLRERIEQARREIEGVAAQAGAKRDQAQLIGHELEGVQKLFDQNLVSLSRLTTLQREAARLSGEEGSLVAELARIRGRIAETELQILQVSQDLRRTVSEELRDVEGRIADLSERRVAALDQLARIEIRAPQAGIVHQSTVHTVGGVIAAGEQIMLIVPESDGLLVEARVDPAMIDRLRPGQDVLVRFTAFDAATTPSLTGQLQHIAAELTTDQPSGVSYYTVRIQLERTELDRLGGKALVPGMPAEAFIQTGARTALAYIAKPIQDQLSRAFRY